LARNFDNWLREYATYTQHSEAPDLFHFWTGVSTIAGALRRRVWIDQRYFQWTPNFYIVFVAPAGISTKSTSIRIGLRLLEEIEGIKFGPQSLTWQALTKSLADARMDMPYGDKFIPMSCITCAVTELGTFLKPDDRDLIDVLVSLWDGQQEVWRKATKTQGSDEIVNPWINIVAATTPAWLRDNFPESLVGGGLTSRILWVYAESKRQLVAYPADIVEEAEFIERGKKLVEDLDCISDLIGEYKLAPAAKVWGTAWYERHWTERPEHLASDRFGGYISRKQTHIHKLAMVIAAAQRDALVIEEGDLITANDFVTGLEEDMQMVFHSIGVSGAARPVKELLAFIRAYKWIEHQTLWRHCMPIMNMKEFSEAINSAVQAGYIEIVSRPEGKFYRPLEEKKDD